MIARIFSTTLVLVAVGAVLGFASLEAAERRVSSVEVRIQDTQAASFLHAERIQDQLGTTRLEGELMGDVDLQSVVNHLQALDPCDHAEVYPTMDGVLHIDVWQRHPVMRVHVEGGEDYYLDEKGRRMNLDPHFTPHIPVMHVSRETQATMGYRFVKATKGDPFWDALTDQLSMNDNGELVMHPRLAGHEIVLGDAEDTDHKKRNLLAFYRAHVKRGNLRNFKRIDLTYRDQVIAQRYP